MQTGLVPIVTVVGRLPPLADYTAVSAPRAGTGNAKQCRNIARMLTSGLITLLVIASAVPLVSAQQHTTSVYKTTPIYNRRTTPVFKPFTHRASTPKFIPATRARPITVPADSGIPRPRITTIPPHSGNTARPSRPAVQTTITSMHVVGNLTGDNICPRAVIETRYVLKNLKFECDRKEYIHCSRCPGCTYYNLTHCKRRIEGECTASVYQYEPIIVNIQHCCDGYEQIGIVCIESVHCQDKNGGCPHICRSNKQAGRHCECYQGFQLNGSRCDDFNECNLHNGGCSDSCVNTVGSFYCRCNTTRQLVSPFQCKYVNACETNNGGCDQTCRTRDGTHYCDCNSGFELKDGRECTDIDECKDGYNQCSHVCENRFGGYVCSCPKGTILQADNYTCSGDDLTRESLRVSHSEVDLFASPVMIGTLTSVAFLLLLVSCVWIICCYVKGACCCQERHKAERRRREAKEDSMDMVVQASCSAEKENGHVNPGYVDVDNNHYAMTKDGMPEKEDIHITPSTEYMESSLQNGHNEQQADSSSGIS